MDKIKINTEIDIEVNKFLESLKIELSFKHKGEVIDYVLKPLAKKKKKFAEEIIKSNFKEEF